MALGLVDHGSEAKLHLERGVKLGIVCALLTENIGVGVNFEV